MIKENRAMYEDRDDYDGPTSYGCDICGGSGWIDVPDNGTNDSEEVCPECNGEGYVEH